jgi:hypothetical protein
MHFTALFCLDFNKNILRSSKTAFSALISILVSGVSGIGFDGNLSQKFFVAPVPYWLSLGISGNFLENIFEVLALSCDVVSVSLDENSHDMT